MGFSPLLPFYRFWCVLLLLHCFSSTTTRPATNHNSVVVSAQDTSVLGGGPLEPYVYVVYHLEDACNSDPVSLIGFVSEDADILYGGLATAEDARIPTGSGGNDTTATTTTDAKVYPFCSLESSCLIDRFSDQCQSLNRTKQGDMTFSVSEDGLIYQCDTSNVDGECSILNNCYSSSVYPNCYFVVKLTSELVADPDTHLKNPDPENEVFHQQGYLSFYSDDTCQTFEGVQGVLQGETPLLVTDSSISCQDAMTCLFHQDGQACQNLLKAKGLDYMSMNNYTFNFRTDNNGRDAILCEGVDKSTGEPAGCDFDNPHSSDGNDPCLPSDLHPSCYFKFTSAVRFMETPTAYLGVPKPSSDATTMNGGDGTGGSASDNGLTGTFLGSDGGASSRLMTRHGTLLGLALAAAAIILPLYIS